MSNKTELKRKRERRARASGSGSAPKAREASVPKPEPIATGWDALNAENAALGHAINTPRLIQPMLADKRVLETFKGEEAKHLAQDVRSLSRDTKYLAGVLAGLRSAHQDRTGPPKDAIEVQEILLISQQYKQLFTQINAAYVPVMLSLTTRLEHGVKQVTANQAATLAQLKQESSNHV